MENNIINSIIELQRSINSTCTIEITCNKETIEKFNNELKQRFEKEFTQLFSSLGKDAKISKEFKDCLFETFKGVDGNIVIFKEK